MRERARQQQTRQQPVMKEGLAVTAVWIAVAALVMFFPGAFVRWFLPKELVFLGAVLIAALPSVRAAGRVPRGLWLLLAAAGVLLTSAALCSPQPMAALFGRWPRYEGLISLPVYVAAVWVGARLLGPETHARRRNSWWSALAIASLAVCGVAALDAWGVHLIATEVARSGSLLGNASDQGIVSAAFAVILLPRLLSALMRRAEWLLPAAGTLAGIWSVALSASRGAVLALGVGIVLSGAGWLISRHRMGDRPALRAGAIASLGVVGVAAIAIIVTPMSRSRLWGTSGLAQATVQDRLLIWGETLDLLRGHPLLGMGPSGYADAISRQHGPEWFAQVGPGTQLDSPHNWILQAFSAGGLLLVALALVVIVVVLLRSGRQFFALTARDAGGAAHSHGDLVVGAVAGLCVIGVGWLTHFTAPSTALLAGMLVGVSVAGTPHSQSATSVDAAGARGQVVVLSTRGTAWVRVAAVSVWIALFSCATAAEFPLAAAHRATSADAADRAFTHAQALRPWDGDIALIAAQLFAERADRGADGAGALGEKWAERALARVPESLVTRVALGVSQRTQGRLAESAATLESAVAAQPHDPRVLVQLGISEILLGDRRGGDGRIEQAWALAPDDPLVAAARAWARSAG